MGLKIKEINVQQRGPVEKMKFQPGLLNLLYGKNEKGKTHLIEFLMQCLFRKNKVWHLRDVRTRGSVVVEGLSSKPEKFTPTSRKLEDYWEQNQLELGPDLSRLLIVKGAEVELSEVGGGIDKHILKTYLSNQSLLDSIEKRILPTILKSEVKEKIIPASKGRGPLQEMEELYNKLIRIDELFQRIDQTYSGGQRQALVIKYNSVQQALEEMQNAKRHLAWQLLEKGKQFKAQLSHIMSEDFDALYDHFNNYRRLQSDIKQQKGQIANAEQESLFYPWLEKAVDLYRTRLTELPCKPPWILWISALILIVISIGSILWYGPLVSIFCVVSGAGLTGLSIWRLFKYTRTIHEWDELRKIEDEYAKCFHESLSGLPQLEARLKSMEKAHNRVLILNEDIQTKEKELKSLLHEINQKFESFLGRPVSYAEWQKEINLLREQQRTIRDKLEQVREAWSELHVNESDCIQDPSTVEYNKKKEDELQQKMGRLDQKIQDEEISLMDLKKEIWQLLGLIHEDNWQKLIQELQEERESVLSQYQVLTADILGKKAVQHVIDKLRLSEDENIYAGLKSDMITKTLQLVTGRYQSIRLDDSHILVSDADQEEFDLSELSTGAQEQVLLALRIGFSMNLLGKESLFLLLDDAFQYSDWERRERLVNMMVHLARHDWQIFYFTMDDHIRDLFQKKGKALGEDFKLINLN